MPFTKYEKQIRDELDKVRELSESGCTDREIAKSINVSPTTFYSYLKKYPEFHDAVMSGRQLCIQDIENALYKRAVGYTQIVKKTMKVKKAQYANGKKVSEQETLEKYDDELYFPPDTSSAIFLLKNWAKNKHYSNDPELIELRRQAMKLDNAGDEGDPHDDD